ncbi:MAG: VacJ family lipoprotein [Victivallales bacterium]|nr:VacJ family lipoprotein [Victivallales bacterium]
MSFIRRPIIIMLLALLPLALVSCATTGQAQTGYLPADTEAIIIYDDPLEGFNRTSQAINSAVEQYAVTPVSEVWRGITPSCLRTGISNFLENLGFPLRFVTHSLQGDFGYAWMDVKRFAVNTTAGVLGFRDPATGWGMPHIEGGFKYTFAKWGIPEGCYLNLPFFGPGSVRDAAGKAADIPFDLASYFLPADANAVKLCLAYGNEVTLENPLRASFFQGQYNHYEFTRILTELAADADYSDYRIDRTRTDYDADETVNFLLFAPLDENFFYQGWQRKAVMSDGGEIPYTCWPKRGARDLVIILPGLGSHRQSSTVSGFAELFRNAGCAVVSLSSTFTPEYINSFAKPVPPGYFPEDTKRLIQAIRAVVADHRNRPNGNRDFRCHIIGYSLGGINTLHLAAAEKDGMLAPDLKISSYLSLNPPRNAMSSMVTLDKFFNIPEGWEAESRRERLSDAAARIICQLSPDFRNPPSMVMPLTRDESQFIIGLMLRSSLAAAVQASAPLVPGSMQEPPATFFRGNRVFAEALAFSFQDYLQKIVLPWYRAAGFTLEGAMMAERCSIDSLAPALAANPRVRLIHNANDFLLQEGDGQWLKNLFGDRAEIFPDGGHLGNMYLPEYRKLVVKMLLSAP